MPTAHRVVIAVFPDVDLLDVTGPAEVFALANRETAGRAGYEVRLAGSAAGAVRTSAGVRLLTDVAFADVGAEVDTLLVPGAVDMAEDGPVARIDEEVVAWVRETAPHARRVASVCVGAHLLAAAGLLDGRTATTHWSTAAQLAADHPAVTVDPAPIFVRTDRGRLWTGAGTSACLDLALALVAATAARAARTTSASTSAPSPTTSPRPTASPSWSRASPTPSAPPGWRRP